MSYGASVNRAILARYLKRAYYFHLINGKGYGPALRSPVLSRRLGRALGLVHKIQSMAAPRVDFARPSGPGVLDDWYTAQFPGVVRRTGEEILLSSHSVTPRILNEEGIRSMLDNLGNPGSGPGAIGILLSVERWNEQIQKVWCLSRRLPLSSFTGAACLPFLSDIECGFSILQCLC